jgi:hypothetical protein
MEAEYVAALESSKDIIFIRNLIKEITDSVLKATVLCDNEAANKLALSVKIAEELDRHILYYAVLDR